MPGMWGRAGPGRALLPPVRRCGRRGVGPGSPGRVEAGAGARGGGGLDARGAGRRAHGRPAPCGFGGLRARPPRRRRADRLAKPGCQRRPWLAFGNASGEPRSGPCRAGAGELIGARAATGPAGAPAAALALSSHPVRFRDFRVSASSYELANPPAYVADGDPYTAWHAWQTERFTDGDWLTLTFPRVRLITRIGLIPGRVGTGAGVDGACGRSLSKLSAIVRRRSSSRIGRRCNIAICSSPCSRESLSSASSPSSRGRDRATSSFPKSRSGATRCHPARAPPSMICRPCDQRLVFSPRHAGALDQGKNGPGFFRFTAMLSGR